MTREIVVVGAGIVGVCTARELTREGVNITVLDRDVARPRGSTAFAPGFVGLYNDAPVLTDLARASASVYEAVGNGFARVGGVELATSAAAAADLGRRIAAAREAGLRAEPVGPGDLPESVAAFVDTSRIVAGAMFPDDGVADPTVLTADLRADATERGVRFVAGDVVGVDRRGGSIVVSTADRDRLVADDVVLAGGVWGPHLAGFVGLSLPLFPVAHPYVYSGAVGRFGPGPFVRWPEHHVYARVHGNRLGIGSYDHVPVPVDQAELTTGAGLAWADGYDPVIDAAQGLLRPHARFEPERRINGVFAITPDNLPFVGRHPDVDGVWLAQAIWITHAAGCAALLAQAIADGETLPVELAVDRFGDRGTDDLRDSALRLYRDIYANDAD